MTSKLYCIPTWSGAGHSFPVRKIRTRVQAAREMYRCDVEGKPSRDHIAVILPGDRYTRVQMRPQNGLPRWRTVRLCAGCSVRYGLASYTRIKGVTS